MANNITIPRKRKDHHHHREAMVELETTVATTFPRFPELPAELRLLIWRFALPRRVFEIRRETVSVRKDGEADVIKDLDHDSWRVRSSDLIAVLLAPPALLSVNREARKLALRCGSWKCVGSRPRGVCGVIRLATWFDTSTDTLCFDDSAIQPVPGRPIERDGLVTEHASNPAVTRMYFASSPASPICLSLAALAGASGKFFVEQWKQKRGFWSGVPQYQFYHDSILMHLGRSPKVQEIFGKGVDRCHTLLVDARDYRKLRQLKELYVEESAPSYFQVSSWCFPSLSYTPLKYPSKRDTGAFINSCCVFPLIDPGSCAESPTEIVTDEIWIAEGCELA